jgi:hypothetical protein
MLRKSQGRATSTSYTGPSPVASHDHHSRPKIPESMSSKPARSPWAERLRSIEGAIIAILRACPDALPLCDLYEMVMKVRAYSVSEKEFAAILAEMARRRRVARVDLHVPDRPPGAHSGSGAVAYKTVLAYELRKWGAA